ncbi:MAG: flagellar biosynthetic protein FliO [Anaerolineales bacterium]
MTQSDSWTTAALFVNVLFKLGLVLLLIYSSVIILRRLQTSQNLRLRKGIKIIETTHLSPHRAIHLVQVANQIYLIGATDHEVTLLSKVDDADLNASLLMDNQTQEKNPLPIPAFTTVFVENLKKRKILP